MTKLICLLLVLFALTMMGKYSRCMSLRRKITSYEPSNYAQNRKLGYLLDALETTVRNKKTELNNMDFHLLNILVDEINKRLSKVDVDHPPEYWYLRLGR